jgi:Tfp pilus assembly ATPase PilU
MNTSLIAELIKSGEFPQIKEAMEQSLYPGSQTFEQSLCRLYLDGTISYDEAMSASDSPTNLAWLINQNSPTARVENLETSVADRDAHRTTADFATLTIDPAMLDRQQQH